jgi:hypothetical protein
MNVNTHPLSYTGIGATGCRRYLNSPIPSKARDLARNLVAMYPELNVSFEDAIEKFKSIIETFEESPYAEEAKQRRIGTAEDRRRTAKDPYLKTYFIHSGVSMPEPETALQRNLRKCITELSSQWERAISPIQNTWDIASLENRAPIYTQIPLFLILASIKTPIALVDAFPNRVKNTLGEGLQSIYHVVKSSLKHLSNTSFSQECTKTIEAIYFKNTTNPEQRRRALLTLLATGGFAFPFILCYSGVKATAKPWIYRDEQQDVNPETAVEPIHAG